jgi:hypothetical protein
MQAECPLLVMPIWPLKDHFEVDIVEKVRDQAK